MKSGIAVLLGTYVCISTLGGYLPPGTAHGSSAPPMSPERRAAADKYQSTHSSVIQRQSQPPADFPIPYIGGAKILGAATMNSQARKQTRVTLSVGQPAASVAGWYRDNLPQKGWKVLSIVQSDRSVLAYKDDLTCNVTITPANNQSSNVNITVMKDNKAKKDRSQALQ